jgi:hypothetical protein
MHPLWQPAAVLATFAVSGLEHELIMLYCNHAVYGNMLAFFMLHGIATVLEAGVSRASRGAAKPAGSRALQPSAKASARMLWLRRATVTLIVSATAELAWWPSFIRYGLDKRLISEWSGWIRNLAPAGIGSALKAG